MIICITNRSICKGDFLKRIEEIAKAKPHAIVLREKDLSHEEYQTLAEKCKKIVDKYNTSFIVHSDLEAAKNLGIKKIHLPMNMVFKHQNEIKNFETVGVSVHSVEDAKIAEKLGATYLIAGHIFVTGTKKDVAPRGIKFLKDVCSAVSIPVFAIGGITKENIAQLRKVGAAGGGIMSAIMTCDSVEDTLKKFISASSICYVVGAGCFFKHDFKPETNDYIIAADGGFKYLSEIGIHPDLIIGDFDSVSKKPKHDNIITLKAEKDDTDMMLALKEGLAKGYKTFHIYGGTGDRPEHTLANVQALAYLSKKDARGFLFGENRVTTVITNGEINFDDDKEGYISVFSYSDKSRGVNLSGLKYELKDKTILNDMPIGVSNEFIGKKSKISVENGTILVIWGTDSDA
ncbi:MAG: thiamine diphosphokinase [Eubacteriales bacterium]